LKRAFRGAASAERVLILGEGSVGHFHIEKPPKDQTLQNLKEEGCQADGPESFDRLIVFFPRFWDKDYLGLGPRSWDITKPDAGFKKSPEMPDKTTVLRGLLQKNRVDAIRAW
jgi:hypothetical protein